MKRTRYNPERKAWRGVSYREMKHVRELRSMAHLQAADDQILDMRYDVVHQVKRWDDDYLDHYEEWDFGY